MGWKTPLPINNEVHRLAHRPGVCVCVLGGGRGDFPVPEERSGHILGHPALFPGSAL